MRETNPYDASGMAGERPAPNLLARALGIAFLVATVIFVMACNTYSDPNLKQLTNVQMGIYGAGLLLMASCAGVGIYGSLKYDIRFLPAGILSLIGFVLWLCLLAFFPPSK